jgi:hypothetical protein
MMLSKSLRNCLGEVKKGVSDDLSGHRSHTADGSWADNIDRTTSPHHISKSYRKVIARAFSQLFKTPSKLSWTQVLAEIDPNASNDERKLKAKQISVKCIKEIVWSW